MALPLAVIAELRRHVPAVDSNSRLMGCSCGFRLRPDTCGDLWVHWVNHLTPGPPAPSAEDQKFLHACHIRWGN